MSDKKFTRARLLRCTLLLWASVVFRWVLAEIGVPFLNKIISRDDTIDTTRFDDRPFSPVELRHNHRQITPDKLE